MAREGLRVLTLLELLLHDIVLKVCPVTQSQRQMREREREEREREREKPNTNHREESRRGRKKIEALLGLYQKWKDFMTSRKKTERNG